MYQLSKLDNGGSPSTIILGPLSPMSLHSMGFCSRQLRFAHLMVVLDFVSSMMYDVMMFNVMSSQFFIRFRFTVPVYSE